MSNDLQVFIARCARVPGALVPLKALWRAFNASLEPGRVGAWSRDRFQCELTAAGFVVADLDNRSHVAGLQLPGGAWRSEDGRLVFAEAAA